MYTSRRTLIKGLALAGSAPLFNVPGAMAEQLIATPYQTEGPFYPERLPLDKDNDLIIVDDRLTPAVGEITHLYGKVMTSKGEPLANALVEIWQVDNNAVYLHRRSRNFENRDTNFQGYGQFETNSQGEYRFRTIKPVSYPGRTPHIHIAVSTNGQQRLSTQCYIKGHRQNHRDGVLRSIRDARARESLLVDFIPVNNGQVPEYRAEFNIVV